MSELWEVEHEILNPIHQVISKYQKLEWLPKQLWDVGADMEEDLNAKSLRSAQMLETIIR